MGKFRVITAVHLFLIDSGDKLLLARRYNTGYADGLYSVIAGHIEEGETAKGAMKREAQEEAGINIAFEDLTFCHVMYRRRENDLESDRIDFFFRCKKWQGKPTIMEKNKCDDMSWFGKQNIPKNTIPYVHSAIQQLISNSTFSEYGW